jgi:hypothetical protein
MARGKGRCCRQSLGESDDESARRRIRGGCVTVLSGSCDRDWGDGVDTAVGNMYITGLGVFFSLWSRSSFPGGKANKKAKSAQWQKKASSNAPAELTQRGRIQYRHIP